MLTYKFTAREAGTGNKVHSEVQAEDEKAAAKAIKAQGYAPLEITLSDKASGVGGFRKKVKTRDKVIFSRQLSTLINAGLPLVQALRNVESQTTSKYFKVVISKVISDVEAGTAFHAALDKFPKTFNHVYISLIQAGEASGTLDKSLERLASQQEKDAEIVAKVRGALIYPALVLVVMGGVVIFMLTTVLPQVKLLYQGIPGVKLPPLTRFLLAISGFIIHFWWLCIIGLVVLAFFGTRWARTGPGKLVLDKLKMKAWPVGPLFMKLYMARFARTGATLIGSGVALLEMLNITAEAVANVHIAGSIHRAAEKVKGGKSLSSSIQGDPNFLELVPNMISIGEQSGSLEDMLTKTADYYEKEVDNQVKNISALIEPVLMIVLGVVALTIVAAILLPIYSLVGKDFVH